MFEAREDKDFKINKNLKKKKNALHHRDKWTLNNK